MISKLVVFGDSWPYGDELVDPNLPGVNCHAKENEHYRLSHSYPGIIANYFNLRLVNLARCGNSLQGMQYALSWWSQQPDFRTSLMLFSLPFAHRMSWFNPDWQEQNGETFFERLWHSSWLKDKSVKPDVDIQNLFKVWSTRISCPLQDFHHLNIATNFFAGFCSMRNIPYVMHHVFKEPFMDTEFSAQELVLENIVPKDQLCKFGHPNEHGHKLISEKLISYIKNNKLLG